MATALLDMGQVLSPQSCRDKAISAQIETKCCNSKRINLALMKGTRPAAAPKHANPMATHADSNHPPSIPRLDLEVTIITYSRAVCYTGYDVCNWASCSKPDNPCIKLCQRTLSRPGAPTHSAQSECSLQKPVQRGTWATQQKERV